MYSALHLCGLDGQYDFPGYDIQPPPFGLNILSLAGGGTEIEGPALPNFASIVFLYKVSC